MNGIKRFNPDQYNVFFNCTCVYLMERDNKTPALQRVKKII